MSTATFYIGQRWAGDSDHFGTDWRYEIQAGASTPWRGGDLTVSEVEKSLILFQGGQVQHRVRPMADGEGV